MLLGRLFLLLAMAGTVFVAGTPWVMLEVCAEKLRDGALALMLTGWDSSPFPGCALVDLGEMCYSSHVEVKIPVGFACRVVKEQKICDENSSRVRASTTSCQTCCVGCEVVSAKCPLCAPRALSF